MATTDGFVVDGKTYTADDLTFREQRELRTVVRSLVEDPEANIEDVALMDLLPALAYIIVKRDRPDYTLDQALDMKMSELMPSEEESPTQAE